MAQQSAYVRILSEDCLWAAWEQTCWAIRPKQTLVTVRNVAMRKTGQRKTVLRGRGWTWWMGWWGGGNRNTSSRGLSHSSHFNLCPGGWRNQCTLILQSSPCLRIEKHCLGEITLPSFFLIMTRYSKQTLKHMYLHTHRFTETHW